MNILLIEDDAGLVELITVMLEELGFSVMSADSGASALAHIKKQTPDLILLDYSLPDTNGKELIETLNKQQMPIPPFIITTGQGDERIAVDMMKLGAIDYLVKDILFLEKIPDVVKRVIKEIESDGKLKQSEKKLTESEENLKNTFDLSPSIICKANLAAGYFIEANQAVTSILGYTIEEFTTIPFIKLIHPDDQQKTTDEKLEQLEGKKVTFFENRYLCKDGSYKWMAWNGTKADKNGIVTAIGSDITERKKAEQEIVKTKQFYENITEGVQDGIWVTDKNDVIFYANSAMEKIAGVPREQIQGNNVLKDFPENTIGEFRKYYKQAKTEKKPVWYVIKVKTPADRDTWQNGWLIPQYQDKIFIGIICTIRDFTERKMAENELKKYHDQLEELVNVRTKELEESNEELKSKNEEQQTLVEELAEANKEQERMNHLFAGREFRIKELRDEIEELKRKKLDQ